MSNQTIKWLGCFSLYFIGQILLSSAWADEDTRLRLNQSVDYQSNQQENFLLKDELKDRPILTINGQNYKIEHTTNDVGHALYLSIQHKQWSAVIHFLDEYLTLPDYDSMLVFYAKANLERVKGNSKQAEKYYRELLKLNPDFLLGLLELARTLFENHNDSESKQLFDQALIQLNLNESNSQDIRKTIDSYLKAIDYRQSWQGTISAGIVWNTNLNQSSESRTCLNQYEDQCLYERKLPDAISAKGLGYEITLNKKYTLNKHHSLFFRGLTYGQSYQDYSQYNENTLITNLGYTYQNGQHQIFLSPNFEFLTYGNHAMHGAWGLKAEWLYNLSYRTMLRFESSYKDMQYRPKNYQAYDGNMYSGFFTVNHVLPKKWTVFGGIDLMEKQAREDEDAYIQKGLRLGVAKQYNDKFNAILFTAFRQKNHKKYSNILEEQRKDNEQNYTLILNSPKLEFLGLTPNLIYQYNVNKSNVDWLYSYDKHNISLKLEHRF